MFVQGSMPLNHALLFLTCVSAPPCLHPHACAGKHAVDACVAVPYLCACTHACLPLQACRLLAGQAKEEGGGGEVAVGLRTYWAMKASMAPSLISELLGNCTAKTVFFIKLAETLAPVVAMLRDPDPAQKRFVQHVLALTNWQGMGLGMTAAALADEVEAALREIRAVVDVEAALDVAQEVVGGGPRQQQQQQQQLGASADDSVLPASPASRDVHLDKAPAADEDVRYILRRLRRKAEAFHGVVHAHRIQKEVDRVDATFHVMQAELTDVRDTLDSVMAQSANQKFALKRTLASKAYLRPYLEPRCLYDEGCLQYSVPHKFYTLPSQGLGLYNPVDKVLLGIGRRVQDAGAGYMARGV